MTKKEIEKTITECIKPVFFFALKRCHNAKDAEDLSQEIALKAFRALSTRQDVENPEKFIWTIAHNALANYYRDINRYTGVSIEDVAHHTEAYVNVWCEKIRECTSLMVCEVTVNL